MNKRFKIALKIRAKHGIVYGYMEKRNLSRSEMAKEIGISVSTLHKILNFNWVPNGEYGSKATAEKLCAFFKCTIDEFLPPEVVEVINSNKEIAMILQEEQTLYKEVDVQLLGFSDVPTELLSCKGNQEAAISANELQKTIDEILGFLSDRKAAVIRKRFLEGKTMEEAAEEMGITRQAVLDNEMRALDQLRHPLRARKLKDFLD